VLFLVAARFLGPSSFGQYMAAAAFVGLFRVLPDFGMAYAATLEISRDRAVAGRLAGGLLGFQTLLSLLTLGLCLGIGRALYADDPATWLAVVVLSVDLLLKAVKSTLRFLLKSLERFGVEALSLLAERLAVLAAGASSLVSGGGVVAFASVFALVRALDAVGLWIYVHLRVVPLRPSRDPALWLDLLRKGLPFAYAGLVITFVFQIDAVLLEAKRGPIEVGWYRAPTLVLEGLTLVPRILGYALLPAMAGYHRTNPESIGELYRRGCKYLMLAGLPIAAFGVIESDRFIPLLFAQSFDRSVLASQILLPAALFMFLSNFSETTLACIERWKTIVIASSLALALNVALNLVWIPAWGYLGSASATLITEAFYLVVTAGAVAKAGHRVAWIGLAGRPLAAGAVFAFTLWLGGSSPFVVAVALASTAFVAATFVFGVWDEKERAALRALLLGRRPDPRPMA
jgi:O-antigen/teichoic acid export membrane protein